MEKLYTVSKNKTWSCLWLRPSALYCKQVKLLSRVWLFGTPWTVAHQAPPSIEFSRQEYWSGLPFPSPGDLPNPGIEPGFPAFQADALPFEPPGNPCIAKLRLKLKKVGEIARPFRYDLTQIPYDYTAEVTNRFKGLDLIECLKNYGRRFLTLYERQWSRPSPRKRNARGPSGCLRRPYK